MGNGGETYNPDSWTLNTDRRFLKEADAEIPLRHILKTLITEKPEDSRKTEFDKLSVEDRVSYFLDWVIKNRKGVEDISKEDLEVISSDKIGPDVIQHKKLGIMGFRYYDKDNDSYTPAHPDKSIVSTKDNLISSLNRVISYVNVLYPEQTEITKDSLISKFSDILNTNT